MTIKIINNNDDIVVVAIKKFLLKVTVDAIERLLFRRSNLGTQPAPVHILIPAAGVSHVILFITFTYNT